MSDTQKDVCWIALDREVAEAWRTALGQHTDRSDFEQAALEACRKSLVTECVELSGEVMAELGLFLDTCQVGKDFSEGPCRVIVIAGERDG